MLSSLAIAPLGDSAMTAAVTSQVSGKRYMFKPNSSEFTNFTADFTNDEGCFTFTLHGRPCSIHFGFGKLVCGQFPVYDQRYAAVIALSPRGAIASEESTERSSVCVF